MGVGGVFKSWQVPVCPPQFGTEGALIQCALHREGVLHRVGQRVSSPTGWHRGLTR